METWGNGYMLTDPAHRDEYPSPKKAHDKYRGPSELSHTTLTEELMKKRHNIW